MSNTIHSKIKEDVKQAMRARDQVKLDTLRGLDALFLNEMISSGSDSALIDDDKALSLIRRSVKQRKDSIESFEKGGRADLVAKEKSELIILESFLPAMMSEDEVRKIVQNKIDELKKSGPIDSKSSGKVVGLLMKELSGKADGLLVKNIVEELLK
jgi:uncharacterized protein YqeY